MLEIHASSGESVVHLSGELDLEAEPQLRSALARAIDDARETGTDVVLDIGNVTFMDSSGLNALIGACGQLPPERRIVLRNVSRPIRRLLDTAGLLAIRNLLLEDGSTEPVPPEDPPEPTSG